MYDCIEYIWWISTIHTCNRMHSLLKFPNMVCLNSTSAPIGAMEVDLPCLFRNLWNKLFKHGWMLGGKFINEYSYQRKNDV